MGTDTETRLLQAMGKRARARREELGMTVNQLAVKMGRTYQCIHGMEKSGTGAIRVLLEWAESLECSADYLCFGGTAIVRSKTATRDLLEQAARVIDARSAPRRELVRRIREELGT